MAGFNFSFMAAVLAAAHSYAAAPTKINGVVYEGTQASAAPAAPAADKNLLVKRIFLFPSLDDMNGVLAPKLDEKLNNLFRSNSRFDPVRDPQVLKALSSGDSGYEKAAQNQAVHREAARVTGSDSTALLTSKNIGNDSEMHLEIRDAQGDLIFVETGSLPGFSSMDARWGMVEKLFQAVVARLPYDGTVTGRTATTLTLDLGSKAVKVGDELDLVRIVSVQRHPLLKTVVGTDYVRVGRARVNHVDRALSFAELLEESPGESAQPGTKILRSRAIYSSREREEPVNYGPEKKVAPTESSLPPEERLPGDFEKPRARYGKVGANLLFGSLTHTQTSGSTVSEYSGSGFGASVDGELWVTKNWIASLGLGSQSANLSGKGTDLGSASWKGFGAYAGYRFFLDALGEESQITGMIGYQTQKYTIPALSSANVSGKTYNGFGLKMAGELLLLKNNKVSGEFSLQPFSSLTDIGTSPGSPDGGTVIGLGLAWNFRVVDLLWARVGFQFDSASGNYTNGATVNNKRFAIGPGLYYSF